ncbi:indole-3-acetate beta-glucosyltransferase [Colletotrichum incanum]|uniref:Indole-3-acetate beta-glucosyltransferase n=1 Tax=Colletotrichum incanum TaxID=1573173 RepID=A0A166MN35_COLIC|nr:indole-3-acetate beta-glucosyltransferase [Colletotrichum incanum]
MTYQQHHVWHVWPAWGHVTSTIALITEMLEVNQSLVVTFVSHAFLDLNQYSDAPRDRFHVVLVGDPHLLKNKGVTVEDITNQLSNGWIETLQRISDRGHDWPRPTALILDHIGSLESLPQARKAAGNGCKILLYWAGSAARLYSYLAPSSEGGFSDWELIAHKYFSDETLRQGRNLDEIVEHVCIAKNGHDAFNGTVISIPGCKDIYDYEREFGEFGMIRTVVSSLLRDTVTLVQATDGIICASAMALEGETLTACNKYTTVYPVGVQIGPKNWSRDGLIEDERIRAYLDRHGKEEVLVISFGSMVFPTNRANFQALISTLNEMKYPFVLIIGGMHAKKFINASDIDNIQSSGVGLVCDTWVDQQAVLQHPSVGWLLAHGGWNSMMESFVQGIPLVGWPLAPGDNAINVALASTRDRPTAFEVMQIRAGSAKAKARRGGPDILGSQDAVRHEFEEIFRKTKGAEGKNIRANTQQLATELETERREAARQVITTLALI